MIAANREEAALSPVHAQDMKLTLDCVKPYKSFVVTAFAYLLIQSALVRALDPGSLERAPGLPGISILPAICCDRVMLTIFTIQLLTMSFRPSWPDH